ncbi:chymotrypsin-like elastase family member 2A isoform X2 [Contarinia nasturtii]|uniref:chymotrypsin-like elastase family member 2A isoform X2 n=1 Tax=Contarinia nasturtii TaxID=265458 RepID=UPI0012D3F80D|nr:chymotrypsin-like elastase family member 2A isoform X2 [Contarinia nasturtii]
MKYFLAIFYLPLFLIGILSAGGLYSNRLVCQHLSDVPAVSRIFPWTAALEYQNSSEFRFLCGGTVISQGFILTAVDCVASRPSVIVQLGNLSLTDNDNDANRIVNYEVE